jgi:hypothetical protein
MCSRFENNGDKSMTESKPQMGPGGFAKATVNEGGATSMPSALPPANLAGMEVSMMISGNPLSTAVSTEGTAPSLPIDGVEAGVSAWQSNQRINALFSTTHNRNSWVGVAGIGWKKLANNSDSAIVALTMLGAHAREKESPVNYREESDGMIH